MGEQVVLEALIVQKQFVPDIVTICCNDASHRGAGKLSSSIAANVEATGKRQKVGRR